MDKKIKKLVPYYNANTGKFHIDYNFIFSCGSCGNSDDLMLSKFDGVLTMNCLNCEEVLGTWDVGELMVLYEDE